MNGIARPALGTSAAGQRIWQAGTSFETMRHGKPSTPISRRIDLAARAAAEAAARAAAATARRRAAAEKITALFRSVPRGHALKIVAEVAQARGKTPEVLRSEIRTRSVAAARQECFWRLREELQWSYPRIGHLFHRDHTSVIHGCRVHAARLQAQGEGQ